MTTLVSTEMIRVKAAANVWVSRNLPTERTRLIHSSPEYDEGKRVWRIPLTVKTGHGGVVTVGNLAVSSDSNVVSAQTPQSISRQVALLYEEVQAAPSLCEGTGIEEKGYAFRFGDGLEGARLLGDRSVDLLLTDPPYGISNAYTCEGQVPRRLRKNGTDFIMPRGYFGEWDGPIEPRTWTDIVLPKVGGWAVIFCAQAQIGEYVDILRSHKFNSVGTLVWHKTNPVPFNHRFKPVNAWEALIVGKRPGTKFNGSVVHNVFQCKSPSPQQRFHPTQKPLQLVEDFIGLFSNEDDLVFDPFAGSATTVVAARRLGRRVLAYENDPAIFRLAHNRVTT